MTIQKTKQTTLEEGLVANDHLLNAQTLAPAALDAPSAPKITFYDLRWQVFALCIANVAQNYLYMSIIPYIAFMTINLVPGLNTQNAGTATGIVIASLQVGRVCFSYTWGVISNKYGRKQVLYWSYFFSGILSIVFGLSSNIYMAIVIRFLLGAGNGVQVVAKTMCKELGRNSGDKNLDGKIMGLVFSMKGWSLLFVPALAGFLSDPVKQFPDSWISTTYTEFLTRFPFFLPNLVAALVCVIGFLTCFFLLPETKPNQLPPNTNLQNSNNSNSDVTMGSIWAKPATRNHLIANWMFLFTTLVYGNMFPLFCLATDGGLSLQETTIGVLLSGSGLVVSVLQYLIFRVLLNRLGIYGTLKFATTLGLPLAILTPISTILNSGETVNQLTAIAFFYLVLLQGWIKICGSLFFSSMSTALNRTVDQHEISIMNGLSVMTGSIGQTLGPVFGGLISSFVLSSSLFSPIVGIYFGFGSVTIFGIILALFTFLNLKRYHIQ